MLRGISVISIKIYKSTSTIQVASFASAVYLNSRCSFVLVFFRSFRLGTKYTTVTHCCCCHLLINPYQCHRRDARDFIQKNYYIEEFVTFHTFLHIVYRYTNKTWAWLVIFIRTYGHVPCVTFFFIIIINVTNISDKFYL